MVFPHLYLLAVMSMTYRYPNDPGYVNIYISGYEDTHVQLETPWDDLIDIHLITDNNRNWNMNKLLTVQTRTQAALQGIRVRTSKPVTIQVTRGKSSNMFIMAYTALEVTDSEQQYFLSSRPNSPIGIQGANPLWIVGTTDQEATISVYSKKGDPSSVLLTETIPQNQMREYAGDDRLGNLTGLYVVSSTPIAAFSGHQCGNVPNGVFYCEPMLQQVPPAVDIGHEYITGPIQYRGPAGYTIRVIFVHAESELWYSTTDSTLTVVNVGAAIKCSLSSFNGIAMSQVNCSSSLLPGDYLEFQTSNATLPVFWRCTKPCYMYQFNHGGSQYDPEEVNTDPFMMLLKPINNRKDTTLPERKIVRFSTISIYDERNSLLLLNFLNVIVSLNDSIILDGSSINGLDGNYHHIGNWTVYSAEVQHGFHQVSSESGILSVQVYGHGPVSAFYTAYGFPASFYVNSIPTTSSDTVLSNTGDGMRDGTITWAIIGTLVAIIIVLS